MIKILIGLFVGTLCGMIPLIFGLLSKIRVLSIVGMILSSVSGMIFSIIDKSPFISIAVSIVFLVLIFAQHRKNQSFEDIDENEDFFDEE